MLLPLMPTGRRIYEEVWAMAQIMLKRDSKFLVSREKTNFWWEDKDWEDILERQREGGVVSPFVLKYVDRQGFNCSK